MEKKELAKQIADYDAFVENLKDGEPQADKARNVTDFAKWIEYYFPDHVQNDGRVFAFWDHSALNNTNKSDVMVTRMPEGKASRVDPTPGRRFEDKYIRIDPGLPLWPSKAPDFTEWQYDEAMDAQTYALLHLLETYDIPTRKIARRSRKPLNDGYDDKVNFYFNKIGADTGTRKKVDPADIKFVVDKIKEMESTTKKEDKIKTLTLTESEARLMLESLIFAVNQLDEIAKDAKDVGTPSTADRLEKLIEKVRPQVND